MGMYTTITDQERREWQFKTGYDTCETYQLGATIPEDHFYADPRDPGALHLSDGIYDAMRDDGTEAWLVIHEGKFQELVPYVHGVGGIEPSELSLFKKWSIQPVSVDLWTEAQWAAKAKRDWADAYRKQCLEAEMDGMTAEERMVFLSKRRLKARLNEKGFMRQILPITEDQPES